MSMVSTSNSSEERQPPSVCVFISVSQNAARFVLLVPLCIFILYQAFKQWRRQRCFSTTSHSDIFTFHNAVMDLLWASGSLIYAWQFYVNVHWVSAVGDYLKSVSYSGQGCFHVLTCVERYLAVVHPVTYRGLKSSRGRRVRDAALACVWLLCFLISFVTELGDDISKIVTLLVLSGLSLVVSSFCSVAVLCVLIRPKPGEGGEDREHIDQSKLRAFYTIMAILGSIWFWVVPFLLSIILYRMIPKKVHCVIGASVLWFNLPCSLVLPLLYLHRTGRPPCCHSNE